MMYQKILLTVGGIVLMASCQSEKTIPQLPNGIWEKRGYGQLMEVTPAEIRFYETTQTTCLPASTIPLSGFGEVGDLVSVTPDSLVVLSGINRFVYTKVKQVPDFCHGNEARAKNPAYNFEVFWNTFREQYAFFKERHIDWDKVYRDTKAKITDKTTDAELYALLHQIVTDFGDDHITLTVPEAIVAESEKLTPQPAPVSTEPEPAPVDKKKLRDAILKRYIQNPKSAGRDLYGKGLVNWGVTAENIGYLQVNWMIFYTDYHIADSLTGEAYAGAYFEKMGANPNRHKDDVAVIRKIMKEVIADFKGTKGVLLDIRMNGGGFDAVGLEILEHFTQSKTLAFSKKAKYGKAFTPAQKVYLEPSESVYKGPVALLTSPTTASAAEIMTLSSMVLPQFIQIGSHTEGIFSDMQDKQLPNGWSFSLSSEVYENTKGQCFENTGIPPTIQMPYPDSEAQFYQQWNATLPKGDATIDKAITVLLQQ